jgi:hypothetical protein
MNLKTKYLAVQTGRLLLSFGCSATVWVTGMILIRSHQFMTYGLGMYPGLKVPKNVRIEEAVQYFYKWSISDLLLYLMAAIAVDCLIRKFLLRIEFAD